MNKLAPPLVSVILASYNHELFINQAIRSVLQQSYENIEVIMVDDGSTDQTVRHAKKIKDQRLVVVALKNNRQQHPRNFGLKKAVGKVLWNLLYVQSGLILLQFLPMRQCLIKII